jgi:hypothetical protein
MNYHINGSFFFMHGDVVETRAHMGDDLSDENVNVGLSSIRGVSGEIKLSSCAHTELSEGILSLLGLRGAE